MRTRSRARRLRALLVLLAAFAAVLPRGAAAAAPAPALAGSVSVTGRATGYVSVTLPRAVDFRADNGREVDKPTVRFTGGAYGWLLLTARSEHGQGYAGVTRMPAAQGGANVFRINGTDPRTDRSLFETSTLPPGAYRLYLLTNGPGSATLRLPGLRGSASVAVRNAASVTETTVVAPVTAGAAPPAHASGVTFENSVWTLVLSFHWADTDAQVVGHYGWCEYDGAPPGGRWVPGCPGGDMTLIGAYGPLRGGLGTGGGFFAPGHRSYGHFYDVAGVVERAGDFYLVLPLH